jgi:hypothetical protein
VGAGPCFSPEAALTPVTDSCQHRDAALLRGRAAAGWAAGLVALWCGRKSLGLKFTEVWRGAHDGRRQLLPGPLLAGLAAVVGEPRNGLQVLLLQRQGLGCLEALLRLNILASPATRSQGSGFWTAPRWCHNCGGETAAV